MIPKFVFDTKSYGKESMHRRINSNIIDLDTKPISAHRRALSNSDLKISPMSSIAIQPSPMKPKPQILPDSLNSSSIQPYLQNNGPNFLATLDASIKHFTDPSAAPNPLIQIADLKAQISHFSKEIESIKENKSKISSKLNRFLLKTKEVEQENEKLQEYVKQVQKHSLKLKGSIEKAESELASVKKKNQVLEGNVPYLRKGFRSSTWLKDQANRNSSDDEVDVFNAEENTCTPFSDPFQFANPSPKVQVKSLYSRPLRK